MVKKAVPLPDAEFNVDFSCIYSILFRLNRQLALDQDYVWTNLSDTNKKKE